MTRLFLFARHLALAFVLVGASTAAGPVRAFEYNILTGGPTGTYIQFGRDIAGAASNCGIELNVRESAGSLENFLGVRQRPVTQFGIVQSDVLEYLRTYAAGDPEVARAIAGVRIAFPLYNEEVHLIATDAVQSLADLAGKKVAIGVQDSGTFLTASLVLDLSGVTDAERLTIGPDESLRQLKAGEIDAFFYVAGAPTKLFQDPGIDPARFHLVPMTDPVLRAVYLPARIEAGTYPFQTEPVDAIAVKAVLMTYEYDPAKNSYHRESCKGVSDITHVILTRFKQLQESGHPKWKQVDLNDIPPGWEVGGCVNTGLAPNYALPCDTPPAAMAAPDESKANSVYRERICAVMGGC